MFCKRNGFVIFFVQVLCLNFQKVPHCKKMSSFTSRNDERKTDLFFFFASHKGKILASAGGCNEC